VAGFASVKRGKSPIAIAIWIYLVGGDWNHWNMFYDFPFILIPTDEETYFSER
jgi:hypothetical protein